MNRREFLKCSLATGAMVAAGCGSVPRGEGDIIDCHTHFYDPTRPQGVPWPGRNETQLYRRVLPPDYRRLAVPLGVTGTVVVEASAWRADNDWILDLAQDEPFIKGFVGNLSPFETDFAAPLKRLARRPLFRGLRVSGGNVKRLGETEPLRHLQLLADLDLSLDVNGGVDSLPAVAALARTIPALRIIIDHVANLRIDGQSPPADWTEGMRRAAENRNVFCKVSGLVEGSGRRNGQAPRQLDFYRPVLDEVWRLFGPERVIYGSNWPVSELFADFAAVHSLVNEYCPARDRAAFFAGNARRAYKWLPRA